jgi:hypothetical protein
VAKAMIDPDELIAAHRHCMNNRGQLEVSSSCGCFFCKAVFPPNEVTEWCDDDQTALCPRCGIDSVLASESGFPVGDSAFLDAMHRRWFENIIR